MRVCVCVCTGALVVAVEVIQPAALLQQLHSAGVVGPGGEAVGALVLFTLAALQATPVGLLHYMVDVVVQTLQRVG